MFPTHWCGFLQISQPCDSNNEIHSGIHSENDRACCEATVSVQREMSHIVEFLHQFVVIYRFVDHLRLCVSPLGILVHLRDALLWNYQFLSNRFKPKFSNNHPHVANI